MEARYRITPIKGMRVRTETGELLEARGREVRWSTYWQRRLNEGAIRRESMAKRGKRKES